MQDRAGRRRFGLIVSGVLVALVLSAAPAFGHESRRPAPVAVVPPPGTIALTFDDGPFEEWTPIILEILARYDIKATFFISTYLLPRNADIIGDILAAGHSVQSHGNQHRRLPRQTRDEILAELQASLDLIVAAGAPRPTCFRPPYGAVNDDVFSVAAQLGLEVVLWTVDSGDYFYQEASRVIESTLQSAGPGDVVLMHDHWAPVHKTALPAIIESLLDEGVGFGPICMPASVEVNGVAGLRVRALTLL